MKNKLLRIFFTFTISSLAVFPLRVLGEERVEAYIIGVKCAEKKCQEAELNEFVSELQLPVKQILNQSSAIIVEATQADIEGVKPSLTSKISYIEKDSEMRVEARLPNDEAFKPDFLIKYQYALWGLFPQGCDAVTAWEVTTGSDKVTVAVIDSGIDFRHPDLAANIWQNSREVSNDGIDNDGNGIVDDYRGFNFFNENNFPNDVDGHGTSVSGIIAAVGNDYLGTAGVTWRSKVLPVKVSDDQGRSSASLVAQGINYVANLRERGATDIVAINISLGGPGDSQLVRTAIENAGRVGLLVIAAAGNNSSNQSREPMYPAAYSKELPHVLSVGSIDANGGISDFSNYGTSVSLAAPGGDVLVLRPTSKESSYAFSSGTSFSAPFVAGTAALVASIRPFNNLEIAKIILQSGRSNSNLIGITQSGKALDANAAVRLAGVYKRELNVKVNFTLNGAPLPSIAVKLSDGSVRISDASGRIALNQILEGTILELTPTDSRFSFSPPIFRGAITNDVSIGFQASFVSSTPPQTTLGSTPIISGGNISARAKRGQVTITVSKLTISDSDSDLSSAAVRVELKGKTYGTSLNNSRGIYSGSLRIPWRKTRGQQRLILTIEAKDRSGKVTTQNRTVTFRS
jgi:subtilisin family serine protease